MTDPYINYQQPPANPPGGYYQTQQYAQPSYQQSNAANLQQQQTQSYTKQQQGPSTGESNLYMALVGMSDSFLCSGQPRLAIHCLESVLTIKSQDVSVATSLHIQLRTRLNLCRLYLDFTLNTNQFVNAHMEKSMIIIQNLNANDELKYEATLTLYELFERQRDLHAKMKYDLMMTSSTTTTIDAAQTSCLYSLDLVRKVLETSKAFPLWHIRIVFLIGVIFCLSKACSKKKQFLSTGLTINLD